MHFERNSMAEGRLIFYLEVTLSQTWVRDGKPTRRSGNSRQTWNIYDDNFLIRQIKTMENLKWISDLKFDANFVTLSWLKKITYFKITAEPYCILFLSFFHFFANPNSAKYQQLNRINNQRLMEDALLIYNWERLSKPEIRIPARRQSAWRCRRPWTRRLRSRSLRRAKTGLTTC